VTQADVVVDEATIGSIRNGWLVLLGVARPDTEAEAAALARRVAELRCFEDEGGKTNLSAEDVHAEILVVSQFTLLADVSRGRRPGFSYAAPPEQALPLVDHFAQLLRDRGFNVAQGQFGAHMRVTLVNDGPFTILLDTAAS
jgi:D-tyrosyl-tRNA(Tyr) deacylase